MLPAFKKTLRNAACAVLWSYFLTKTFVADTDRLLLGWIDPTHEWLVEYRILFFLSALCVSWYLFGTRRLIQFLLFLAVFPIYVIVGRLMIGVVFRWPSTIALAPAFADSLVNVRASLSLLTVTLFATAIVVSTADTRLLQLASLMFAVTAMMRLAMASLKAYRATIFPHMTEYIRRAAVKVEATGLASIVGAEPSPTDPEATNTAFPHKRPPQLTFYMVAATIDWIRNSLRQFSSSRRVDLYLILSLLGIGVQVMALFWGCYYATGIAEPSSYAPPGAFSAFAALRLSLDHFLPGGVPALIPTTTYAIALSYLEGFCAIWTVGILAFSLLTAARERYRTDAEQFLTAIEEFHEVLARECEAAYQLALPELERVLLPSSEPFVQRMRSLRGLPELPKPATPAPTPPVAPS